MPGSDPLWYCHSCNAEMRPIVMTPEPLCASCNSPVIEQLSPTADPNDDPRAFNAMSRLFDDASTQAHDHRGVGGAIDPIGQMLGAMLGIRNLGPATPPAGAPPSSPGSAPSRPTIGIRRRDSGEGDARARSGSGLNFSFRSGSGSSTTGGGSGFGMFGGFGRREERREPANIEDFLATVFQGGQVPSNAQGPRASPLLQNMLMGLFGAGIGNPGVGMGAHGDGRWGDYALNQEALDQIITQLMEGNTSAPVPVPEDMISSWPRTILTPGNSLENEDCAVCKDSFAFIPPESDSSSNKEETIIPQEALTLPCKHSFHVDCIEPWVKVKGTCPVCRFELVSQDGRGGNGEGRNDGNPSGGGASAGGNSGTEGAGLRPAQGRAEDGRGSPMPPGAYELD